MKTPERLSAVFIGNFGHISLYFLVFLLLILNKKMFAGSKAINLKTLKSHTVAITTRCTKVLAK